MMGPSAAKFAGDVSSRYGRVGAPFIRPVDAVLRALPPAAINHRIFVDARSWRVTALPAAAEQTTTRRTERVPRPVVMQIIERLRRDDASPPGPALPMMRVQPVAEGLRARRHVDSRSVRGVTMVLAQQAVPSETRVVNDVVRANDPWPSSSLSHKHSAGHAAIEPAPPSIDVNHLTERVVAAIDRRMMAARERMGR